MSDALFLKKFHEIASTFLVQYPQVAPALMYEATRNSSSVPSYAKSIMKDDLLYIDKRVLQQDELTGKVSTHTFSYANSHIELTLYHTTSLPDLETILQMTCFYVFLLNTFCKKTKPHVNIVLTSFSSKKQFPKSPQVLSPFHVNSAVCFKDFIFVYRQEEFFKTYLHELCHLYDVDFSHNTEYDRIFAAKNKITSPKIALYESYNELITTLFAIGTYIMFKYRDAKEYSSFHKRYQTLRSKVSSYVLNTVAKIMINYNCKEYCGFKEGTHVFSYYVCKAAILDHYNDFMKWLGVDIALQGNYDRIKSYIDKLDSYLDTAFKEKITQRIQYGSKVWRNPALLSSLRMLNIEINPRKLLKEIDHV